MKKFILLFMAFAGYVSVMAEDILFVRTSGGDRMLEFSSVEKIVFPPTGGVSVFISEGASVDFSEEEFVSLRFDSGNSGTGTISEDNADALLRLDGEEVVSTQAGIVVYDIKGRPVMETDGCILSVGDLAKGVYVIVSGGLNLKMTKR